MSIISHFKPQGFSLYTLATETYPMDLVSGATAGFALRKLRSAYTGNCIKIRRSTDDATLDVGFAGYYLDFQAIQAFIGNNSAFIDTWYDQSGNGRNLTQATFGSQPQLINAGVYYLTIGNYPGLENAGSYSLNSAVNANEFITTSNGTVFSVFNADTGSSTSGATGRRVWAQTGSNAYFTITTTPNLFSGLFAGADIVTGVGITLGSSYVGVWRHASSDTTLKVYANSQTEGGSITAGTSDALTGAFRIGNSSSGPGFDGRVTELISYNTA